VPAQRPDESTRLHRRKTITHFRIIFIDCTHPTQIPFFHLIGDIQSTAATATSQTDHQFQVSLNEFRAGFVTTLLYKTTQLKFFLGGHQFMLIEMV
jgi:hypothetical protein